MTLIADRPVKWRNDFQRGPQSHLVKILPGIVSTEYILDIAADQSVAIANWFSGFDVDQYNVGITSAPISIG